MNRGAQKDNQLHENYVKTVKAMLAALQGWQASSKATPRFVFPPKDVVIGATLDEFGMRFARDYGARELVTLFCKIGREVAGAAPTVVMLEIVLELAKVPVERVPLAELGLPTPTTN